MAKNPTYQRFMNLGFEDFRRLAQDDSLSKYERIGFPDEYRANKEEEIFADILSKLTNLTDRNKVFLDIGPGCSELPFMLLKHLGDFGHRGIFVDSAEMLSHLPDQEYLTKVSAFYPRCDNLFDVWTEKIDAILCYSVLHYIFVEANIWEFLDKSLSLLAPGGQFLIGDIPNISKRKRFFSSEKGVAYHQQFTGRQELPEVHFNRIELGQIDDSVVLALIQRARNQGFDAYLLPQNDALPMANRREDILIVRP